MSYLISGAIAGVGLDLMFDGFSAEWFRGLIFWIGVNWLVFIERDQ